MTTEIKSQEERHALLKYVREGYMEVFPTPTIEAKMSVLEPRSYVAVTCSPSKSVDVTLDMSERLADQGFKVVPHIAAKMVRDVPHLREIMKRLDDLPIISVFVPGGDAAKPIGEFACALDLLRSMAEFDHKFTEIGVAAHPEGHPSIDPDVLMDHLLKKQEVSNYLVTQMCFDVDALASWIRAIRDAGVTLPAWIGLPGVSDRSTLVKTSLRIGVGDSLRYLKNRGRIATRLLRSKTYKPDALLKGMAPYLVDPRYDISGYHIYCFNQVELAEEWRHGFIDELLAQDGGSAQ